MNRVDTFVYLLEEDTMQALLPDWPEQMQVALCLTSDGGCDMAVHHASEVGCVLDRVAKLYGGTSEELCVAPQIDGYQTRKVLFSEEQQLFSLVAENPTLTELADDYSRKFHGTCESSAPKKVTRKKGQPAQPGATPTNKTDKASLSGLPSDYDTPPPEKRPECMFLEAALQSIGASTRLTLQPNAITGNETPVPAKHIAFRDDFERFVLPLDVLDGWSPGQARIIDIPDDLLPEAMVLRFQDMQLHCSATVTERGVFLAPGAPAGLASPAFVAASQSPAPRSARGGVKSLTVAGGVLCAVLLASGHLATARDKDSGHLASHVLGASTADAALDLISVMAQQDLDM
ncbi:hypothetical protein [Roseinatronobacter sp.]